MTNNENVELVEIVWSEDAKVWRLFTPQRRDAVELPSFHSLHDPEDIKNIDGIIQSLGYKFKGAAWHDEEKGYLIPVAPSAG